MSSRMVWRTALITLIAGAAFAPRASAQEYFGQNQVQYKDFDWQVIETEHFLIHYYPSERQAAMEGARMAERDYTRLSRILGHEFREKKPILFFASRADFGQNNVTGDLGEGTGGVTEPLRHRMLMPFTGDFRGLEHVLTHEMVHEFQFDIFARGRAGGGIAQLSQVNPPLWFMEGMAEYLSLGPDYPRSSTVMRDAAINGDLPTIVKMNEQPDRYDPYRFGQPLWAYVAGRFGDEVIGAIMADVPSMGIERAFKRETGESLEDLGDEWKEAMQIKYLPQVAQLERPRHFSQPLLSQKRTGGQVFLAPALSPDGKYIAFLSNGSFLKGQVFIDLWLGDAKTGKRIARLVKSTFDPNYQEIGILYSQSSFSPDGKTARLLGARRRAGGALPARREAAKAHCQDRAAAGWHRRAELVAGRQASRVLGEQGRHHGSLHRRCGRQESHAADARRVCGHAAAVVARRNDDRLRDRSGARRGPAESAVSALADRDLSRRWRQRRADSRARTASTSIRRGRRTRSRSPSSPIARAGRTSSCTIWGRSSTIS